MKNKLEKHKITLSQKGKTRYKEEILYNFEFDLLNYGNGTMHLDSPIEGQGREPYSSYRVGKVSVEDAGCGAIAIYNTLVLKGNNETYFSEILSEINGRFGSVIFGAKLGISPYAISRYFRKRNISFKKMGFVKSFFSSNDQCNSFLYSHDYSILLYKHASGAHYITVKADHEELIIYNSYNHSKTQLKKKRIEDYLNDKKDKVVMILGFKK